jgi:hypothetical protein
VFNLDAWYAQAHPAEDFAETFAVWLKPGTRWRRQYEDWGAMRKLEYVDGLMSLLVGRTARPNPIRAVDPLGALRKTLREHYRKKRAYYTIDWPASYERTLYRIFSTEPRHAGLPGAAQFLRRYSREICRLVAQGTGVHQYTVNYVVKRMIDRCRELNLRVAIPEAQAKQLCIVALTTQVMQVLRTGYHRIPL